MDLLVHFQAFLQFSQGSQTSLRNILERTEDVSKLISWEKNLNKQMKEGRKKG